MRNWSLGWLLLASVLLQHEQLIVSAEDDADDADDDNHLRPQEENSDEALLRQSFLHHFQSAHRVVDWSKESHGGYVHPRIELGQEASDGQLGWLASGHIDKDELVLKIPKSTIFQLNPNQYRQTRYKRFTPNDIRCETTRQLFREFSKTKPTTTTEISSSSPFAPYLEFLDSLPYRRDLPSAFSPAGRALLLQGLADNYRQVLPPRHVASYDWQKDCMGSLQEQQEEEWYYVFLQKSYEGSLLIPLWDILNHRNGEHWTNVVVETDMTGGKEDIIVKATQSIEAGEELYVSWNMCGDNCQAEEPSGTPELWRDHGIIEPYPQEWAFPYLGANLAFELDYETDSRDSSLVVTSWLGDEVPNDEELQKLEAQLERVEAFMQSKLQENTDPSISNDEFESIQEYYSAMVTAMKAAIYSSSDVEQACRSENGETCTIASKYDSLEYQDDFLDYRNHKTCEEAKKLDFVDFEQYPHVESPYHKIHFYNRPSDNNTCFDIDNVVQICSSYRPHYHECEYMLF